MPPAPLAPLRPYFEMPPEEIATMAAFALISELLEPCANLSPSQGAVRMDSWLHNKTKLFHERVLILIVHKHLEASCGLHVFSHVLFLLEIQIQSQTISVSDHCGSLYNSSIFTTVEGVALTKSRNENG